VAAVGLDPAWWRGYRGCLSPPDLGGEPERQSEGHVPPVRDKRDRIVRQVPLEIVHQQLSSLAAQEACRKDLDVLIDACGCERVLIRNLGVRTAVIAGRFEVPATATLRVSVYLIEEAVA
jgi:hypothetical protein